MINDMMDELDVVKVAKIADRVMEHSTYFMVAGVFFAFLTILILSILIMLLLKGGKAQKACTCGNASKLKPSAPPEKDMETATVTTSASATPSVPSSPSPTPFQNDDDIDDDDEPNKARD